MRPKFCDSCEDKITQRGLPKSELNTGDLCPECFKKFILHLAMQMEEIN